MALTLNLRNEKRHRDSRKKVKEEVKKIEGLDHSKDKNGDIKLDKYAENLRR